MEASGFISTASKFSHLELIQSFKVVSDNSMQPILKMDGSYADSLIRPHMDSLGAVINQLSDIRKALESKIDISEYREQFQHQWRFSAYQLRQLEKMLRRWQLLLPEESPFEQIDKQAVNPNTILTTLGDILDSTDFSLNETDLNV